MSTPMHPKEVKAVVWLTVQPKTATEALQSQLMEVARAMAGVW